MKRIFVILLSILIITGCLMKPSGEFVEIIDDALEVVGPAYCNYILDDEQYSSEQKEIIIESIRELRRMVKEELGRVKK